MQDSLKLKWDSDKFTKALNEAQKALTATEQKASLLRKRLAEMERVGVTDETRSQYNYLAEQLEKTELNALKLKNQLKELDEIKLKNLTSGLDNAVDKLETAAQKTKALSIAAAGALTGLAALGIAAVNQADEIATLATKYDMSTDALQRFNYVALQTDTQAEDLYKAFVKVQGGVADLQSGVESVSTKALDQLGLSFDQFSGKEEQFYAIIDALANMEDQAKMVSLANDIFGEKMATNLFPLIYAGTDAVNQYKEEFSSMGALTEEQIASLAEFDNVLNELKVQFMNAGLQLGEALLPVMKEFAEILKQNVLPFVRDLVGWFSDLDTGTQKLILGLLAIVAALSPTLILLAKTGSAISSIITWLGKLDKATLKTYGSWALLLASVGALFSVIANWSNMNPIQKVIGLLGALSAAALAAALAFGAFHSAWSLGVAVAGIVAGIAAATAAIATAGKSIGVNAKIDSYAASGSTTIPDYTAPKESSYGNSVTNNSTSYTDNSNVTINIEKNEYMSEDDIIKAVNKGLRLAKQARV